MLKYLSEPFLHSEEAVVALMSFESQSDRLALKELVEVFLVALVLDIFFASNNDQRLAWLPLGCL